MSTLSTPSSWEITNDIRTAVDNLFANCTNSTPGAAMAIYRDGEIVYTNGYGIANLEYNIPITPETIFDIASISKQFTAMCIALLQQDGLLNVDDPIQKHVTELPQWDHPVTVRHLIHHVSGLRDYLGILPLAGWRDEDQMTNADCLKYIGRQKTLEFEPNTRYSYSNSGYVLLATLVERVSGMPMAQFAKERILQPLGMTRSHFNDDHATVIPGRAQAYSVHADGNYRLDMMPLDDLVGDGALFTSVVDFGRWIANFTTGKVGGLELLEVTQTPGTFTDGTPMDYAWGLGIDTFHGYHRVGHSGGWAGYSSNYFRLPELGFSVVVFANGPDVSPSTLTDKIAEIVLANAFTEESASETHVDSSRDPSSVDLGDVVLTEPELLAGTYTQDGGDAHLIIDFREQHPLIDSPRGALTLHRQEDGTFTQKWGHFVIIPATLGSDNRVESLNVNLVPDNSVMSFRRAEVPFNTDAAVYAGRYYSDELDTIWDVETSLETRSLIVRRLKHDGITYSPIAVDHFGTGGLAMGVSIRFQRDRHNGITGFTYTGGRIGTIAFSRLG